MEEVVSSSTPISTTAMVDQVTIAPSKPISIPSSPSLFPTRDESTAIPSPQREEVEELIDEEVILEKEDNQAKEPLTDPSPAIKEATANQAPTPRI